MEPPPPPLDLLASTSACLLNGSEPEHSPAQLASLILSCARECAAWELACVSISLVAKTVRALESGELAVVRVRFWEELLRLLGEERLLPRLVEQFQSRDRLVSHLSAKAASCWVVRMIRRGEAVPSTWKMTCEQNFLSCSAGPELNSCLWSLTEVCKRFLSGAPPELLQNLLAELHRSISVLCSALLPESPASGLSGTTLCLLLDLVEVLMASALQCGEKAGLRKQDLGWVQWPRLLVAVSGPSDPFVKRRTLLLLKRVLLLKPGEEWTTGGRRLTAKPGAELAPVAHAVLAAVDAGWLDSIRVGSHTFFGGGVPRGGGADEAMLRAASLLLLRSLDVSVHAAGPGEMGGASKLSRYLQRLWAFLRRWTPPQVQVEHLCCYLTVLFGEQDDDLMEAARAFLSVFLSSRGGSDLQTACSLGCNPHCHFVLLLRSFSFDHSLLLDFLIGTETCFLEYLVHYLRYLRRDWEGLTAACRASGGVQQPVGGSTGSGCGVRAVSAGSGPSAGSTLSDGLRLVEYDSSDESTEEETEDGGSVWRSRSECWSQPRREAGQVDMDLLDRTVRCLSELREVLVRLHSRQLFPYNPSSLLKLLAQVEAACDGGQTPT